MNEVIEHVRTAPTMGSFDEMIRAKATRRLEEVRALLERLAANEEAPEGATFESWAKELLA